MPGWGSSQWASSPWGSGTATALAVGTVAGNLALAGGTAHLSITRALAAGNLSLTGGTHTPTKHAPVFLSGPQFSLTAGTAQLSLTRSHAAAALALTGGTATFEVSNATPAVALTAACLTLAGGTHGVRHDEQTKPMPGDQAPLVRAARSDHRGLQGSKRR